MYGILLPHWIIAVGESSRDLLQINENDNPYFLIPLCSGGSASAACRMESDQAQLNRVRALFHPLPCCKRIDGCAGSDCKSPSKFKRHAERSARAAYYPSLLRWIILYGLTNTPKETHLDLVYQQNQMKSLSAAAKSSWQALVERFTNESGLKPRQTIEGGPESYYEAYNYWTKYNADTDPRTNIASHSP